MDNLSAGTVSLLLIREKSERYQPNVQRRYRPRLKDSAMPSTDSSRSQKLDGFPLESLDAFDRNHWMTSIGISGCFRLESVDGLPRNTQSHSPSRRAVQNDSSSRPALPESVRGTLEDFRRRMKRSIPNDNM